MGGLAISCIIRWLCIQAVYLAQKYDASPKCQNYLIVALCNFASAVQKGLQLPPTSSWVRA